MITKDEFWDEFAKGRLIINCKDFIEEFLMLCKYKGFKCSYHSPEGFFLLRCDKHDPEMNVIFCRNYIHYRHKYEIVNYIDIFNKNKGEESMTEDEFWNEFKTGKLVINCYKFSEEFISRCKENKVKVGYSYPKNFCYFRFSVTNNAILCGDIDDYKNKYRIVYYFDIFKKNRGEKVKYKLLKLLTGEEIYKAGACVGDREKFINHFGFAKTVDWNEENESWITKNIPEGIEWGIKNGFIEKIETIEYDKNKVYCFKDDYLKSIHILTRVSDIKFTWTCLSNTDVPCANHGSGTPEEVIDNVIKQGFNIKAFDNIQQALNNYFPRPSSKIPRKTDRVKILYDLTKEFGMECSRCGCTRFECN
jgi:hypothetical protein